MFCIVQCCEWCDDGLGPGDDTLCTMIIIIIPTLSHSSRGWILCETNEIYWIENMSFTKYSPARAVYSPGWCSPGARRSCGAPAGWARRRTGRSCRWCRRGPSPGRGLCSPRTPAPGSSGAASAGARRTWGRGSPGGWRHLKQEIRDQEVF